MADPVADPAVSTAQDDSGSQPGGTKPVPTVDVPEYLSGVVAPDEFATMSEKDRERIAGLGKRLHGDYTRKSQEVAELRRIQDQLNEDPELAQTLKKSMAEHAARKAGVLPAKSNAAEAAKSRLDALLDEATPEQQRAFTALIGALDERYQSDLSEKTKKLTELESTVKSLLSDTQVSRREVMEKELSALPEGYKPLVEKHREALLKMGTHPTGLRYSVKKLLQLVADPEAYEQAVLASLPEQTKKSVEKVRQTATGKPATVVASPETPEAKRLVSRDPRFKKGPVDVHSVLGDVFATVKRGMGVT